MVLGISTQELRHSVPGIWSVEEGVSVAHPPGDYLDLREGRIVEVRRSGGWRIRQRARRTLEHWPGSEIPISRIMGEPGGCRLDGMDCLAYLQACYAHVVERIRRDGGRPVEIFVERYNVKASAAASYPPERDW